MAVGIAGSTLQGEPLSAACCMDSDPAEAAQDHDCHKNQAQNSSAFFHVLFPPSKFAPHLRVRHILHLSYHRFCCKSILSFLYFCIFCNTTILRFGRAAFYAFPVHGPRHGGIENPAKAG
jgi:hypothetical protein